MGWEGIRIFDVSDPANPQYVTSVYTDRSNPVEVVFYDPANGSVWASCFYNNFIYTNDIVSGVDVFLLSSMYRAGADRPNYLNPQTQE